MSAQGAEPADVPTTDDDRIMLLQALLLAAAPAPHASPTGVDEWPHLRGPALDGSSPGPALEGGVAGLEVAWRAELGPGYSGVAVAEGRAVTLFSDGSDDVIAAFDAATGGELWRRVVAPTYLGHDGSEDGPISSPTIAEGAVYAVGPRGQLLALALEDGSTRFELDLIEDLGAAEPDYGFSTTPLVEGGLVIVQAGGSEGRLVCALDPASGELWWSAGEGEAGYASPVAFELAGERQIVVLNGQELLGLAPETGAVLWTHALGERELAGSGVAGGIDGERFFANVGSGTAVFRVAASELGFTVERAATSRDLGRSYAAAVHHDGYLYGYRSDFLTCVEAETGERRWRSRPPGGKGLVGVGDRLAVFGAEGALVLVRATPEGYEEEARAEVLEHSSFTWPAFAGDRVYLRNNAELVSVELIPAEAVAVASEPSSASVAPLPVALTAALASSSDPSAAVDAFLAGQSGFPIVEGGEATFVWRGEAEDVAVLGTLAGGGAVPLVRVEETDLFVGSFPVEQGVRHEYAFQVDFGRPVPDPLNPRTVPGERGPRSELVTPGYAEETHFLPPADESESVGRLESFEFTSEALGNTREIQVYLPGGYADGGEERYPLLIVHQGPEYLEKGGLQHTLDRLIGDTVRPLVVAFVTPIPQWWFEAGGTGTEEYLDVLATDFLAELEGRYRLLGGPEHRVLLGQQAFGLACVYAGLRHPDAFGGVALQSPLFKDIARHEVERLIAEDPLEPVAFHIDWNRYEPHNPDDFLEADHAAGARGLYERLRARGYEVSGGEALDSAGWGAWRARTDDLLERFFALERAGEGGD